MPVLIHFLCTVDPSLGRLDYASFSQQTLMELFIDKITNKEVICGSATNPTDISEWPDVFFADSHIVKIDWSYLNINGSIALEWLPQTVQRVSIKSGFRYTGQLFGTVNLTDLPDGFGYLELPGNRLQGTISLTSLPIQMDVLDVSHNRLSGPLDLTQLPRKLVTLNLSWNDFSGVADFTQLPDSLNEISIDHTRLQGVIVSNPDKMMCRVGGSGVRLVLQ